MILNRLKHTFKHSIWLADLCLILCALFWGLGFVAMKEALDALPTFWLLAVRFTCATFFMCALFRKRIRRASPQDLRGGLVIGCFMFLAFAVQTLALNYTTAGKQAFLTSSYVVIVPFLTWLLTRIFPGWFSIAASAVCFCGMWLLTSNASGPLNIGDMLTILCALLFAMQIIAIDRYAKKGDPFVLTTVQIAVTAVCSLAVAPLLHGSFIFKGMDGVPEIAFSIVFCTVLAFLVQNVAQKYTPTTHVSILLSLESVFGVLGGIVLLGEPFTARMGAGCLLIFASVLVVELAPVLLRGGRRESAVR